MATLHFCYSTMNAGKTTTLLQQHHNYTKKNIKTLIFIPYIANKEGLVISRLGINSKGIIIYENFNIFKYLKNNKTNIKVIFIDEVQFLKKKHIFQLINIVDKLNISIFTYGLRTDFKSKLFEGSKHLLSLADNIVELQTVCYCGDKATMNIKVNNEGKKLLQGKQIDINKKNYKSVCRKHYYQTNNTH